MRRSQHPAVRTWHVFARGARRLALFYEDADYRHFLLFLQEALILSGCALFGYVLMGNHYHLILRGSQAQLTRCMQRLNHRYALFHNDTHRMGGHVFDGPYEAYPQRTLRWLLWRLAYVFLNPVTAGWVGEAGDYRWSGYRSFMGLEGSPLAVTPLPDLASVADDLPGARLVFKRLMASQQALGKSGGSTTPTAAAIQGDQFEWIRGEAERRARLESNVDPASIALLWGRDAGIPPRVMAKALGWDSGKAASDRLRDFREYLDQHPDLAARLTP